ncbi:MAG: dTDP-4-dehydrorhamnose 3,5-epimerase family protein [Rikenellaceae bacterium]
MQKFTVKQTPIEDLLVISPNTLGESRVYLSDLEAEESIAAIESIGIEEKFVHHSAERLARGVLRGLHFQREDSYGRMIAVAAGRILCVAVDLRPDYQSFGAAYSVEIHSENEIMLYVPPYFAMGFMTLEPKTEVIINSAAVPDIKAESGIIWDDEVLNIDWQFERYEIDEKYLNISPRDKKSPSFRMYNPNTIWINRPRKSKYALSRKTKQVERVNMRGITRD